jgi:hypothetical protein
MMLSFTGAAKRYRGEESTATDHSEAHISGADSSTGNWSTPVQRLKNNILLFGI